MSKEDKEGILDMKKTLTFKQGRWEMRLLFLVLLLSANAKGGEYECWTNNKKVIDFTKAIEDKYTGKLVCKHTVGKHNTARKYNTIQIHHLKNGLYELNKISVIQYIEGYKTHIYKNNGPIRKMSDGYTFMGVEHREDGPARIQYYPSGKICEVYHYLNGNLHRTDGPAYVSYYEDGGVIDKWFYINGKQIPDLKYFED